MKTSENGVENEDTANDFKKSRHFYKIIFNAIQDGVSVLDRNLTIIKVNRWMKKLYNSDLPIVGRKCYEVYQYRSSPCPWCPSLPAMQDGRVHTSVVPFPSEDNPTDWMEITANPLKDKEGKIIGIIEHVKQITERKKAEEELVRSKRKYQTIISSMSDIIFILDGDDHLKNVYYNEDTQLYLPQEEFLGKQLQEVMPPEFSEIYRNVSQKLRETGKTQRVEYSLDLEGKKRWYEANLDLHLDGESIVAGVRDITQRKESQERFRTLYENIAGGILIIGEDYKIADVNERTCEITGFSKNELIGKLCDIVCPRGSKSERCPIWDKNKQGFQGMDTTIKCKNGYKNPILKNAKRIKIKGKEYILEIFQDISKKKQAEEQLKEAFYKVDFYKDLLAHDIGNILHTIKNSVQLMELYKNSPSSLDKRAEIRHTIEKQIERGASLISNVRKLSEIEKKEVPIKPVDIKLILNNTIQQVQARFQQRKLKIITDFPQETIKVEAGDLLFDSFENVLLNGIIHNESDQIQLHVSLSRIHKNNKELVQVEFKDNGIGIIEERKRSIFERDYRKTSTEAEGGMGLGLSLVKKIIEGYNGHIVVRNRVKGDYTRGSNFIITLKEA
jgi:PAS domain S-box-containing protein